MPLNLTDLHFYYLGTLGMCLYALLLIYFWVSKNKISKINLIAAFFVLIFTFGIGFFTLYGVDEFGHSNPIAFSHRYFFSFSFFYILTPFFILITNWFFSTKSLRQKAIHYLFYGLVFIGSVFIGWIM